MERDGTGTQGPAVESPLDRLALLWTSLNFNHWIFSSIVSIVQEGSYHYRWKLMSNSLKIFKIVFLTCHGYDHVEMGVCMLYAMPCQARLCWMQNPHPACSFSFLWFFQQRNWYFWDLLFEAVGQSGRCLIDCSGWHPKGPGGLTPEKVCKM